MGVCSDGRIFSTEAILVFIFYVRSTVINPADPGIMYKINLVLTNEVGDKRESIAHDLVRKYDECSKGTHSCPSSHSRSSFVGANSSKKGSVESVKYNVQVVPPPPPRSTFCHCFGGFLCTIFVLEDCWKQDEATQQEGLKIQQALSKLQHVHGRIRSSLQGIELDDDFEVSNTRKASSYFHHCRSFQLLNIMMMENNVSTPWSRLDSWFSIYDRVMYKSRQSDCSYDPNVKWDGSSE
ncbi:hypothetical protein OROHE_000196 [Orobanche hederae]